MTNLSLTAETCVCVLQCTELTVLLVSEQLIKATIIKFDISVNPQVLHYGQWT